jgi:hypothetical protein
LQLVGGAGAWARAGSANKATRPTSHRVCARWRTAGGSRSLRIADAEATREDLSAAIAVVCFRSVVGRSRWLQLYLAFGGDNTEQHACLVTLVRRGLYGQTRVQ